MILLTSATGRVGSSAAKALSRAGLPFRALVRNPDKVAFDSDRVEVAQGDLNDPAIVEQALQGISRALIVMGNHPDQSKLERQFASLAPDAGVSHLVKVSSMEAAPDATATLPKNDYDTEQHIDAGSLEEQTSTAADLLGRPVMDLETFTQQFAGAFAPAS
jgi:uncharacterized protein YbjT (DUF2867 family)